MKKSKLRKSVLTIGLLILLLSPFIVQKLKDEFIFINVKIGHTSLVGMDYMKASLFIEDNLEDFLDNKVIIKFRDKKYESTFRKLGVKFDSYKTAEKTAESLESKNFFQGLFASIGSIFTPNEIIPEYEVDQELLIDEVKNLIPEIEDPKAAEIIVDEKGNILINKEKNGVTSDFNQISEEIKKAAINLEENSEIEILEEKIEAAYTEKEASTDAALMVKFLEQEKTLISKEPRISYKENIKIPANWINIKKGHLSIDKKEIKNYLEEIAIKTKIEATDAILKSVPEESIYAEVENIARDGLILDKEKSAEQIIEALQNNEKEMVLAFQIIPSQIINENHLEYLGELKLISQGRSNFKGSPEGRSFNIKKGLEEKINNLLLKPGDTFAFNDTIGPVTNGRGWKNALAIFGGVNLVPVPGGGLCQVATTTYRAALNLGLPIEEQFNHSLHVHYYTAFGNGLDSTVFPGQKDLKFVNDTGKYLLIQAYTDGDDAFVNFYGTPDDRKIELIGPFFNKKELPEEYKDKVYISSKDIVWIQKITKNGETEEKILKSTYKKNVQR